MAPATVTKIPLNQIATQQPDAILFDVTSVSTLGTDPAFLIFYLSKDDEFNGYGTVIQLDPQTKQAAIYADLNPEYTYLFYVNEQGQLQTLLWCIEVASQTSDGLFIAHAKSYGRGISAEDLKLFKQVDLPENQPQPQHNLAESYSPAQQPAVPPTPSTPVTTQQFNPTATPAPQPAAPVPTPAASQPSTMPMENKIPAAPLSTPEPAPAAAPPPTPLPASPTPAPSGIQPTGAELSQQSTANLLPYQNLSAPDAAASQHTQTRQVDPPPQPLRFTEDPANSGSSSPVENMELNLPPIQSVQPQPTAAYTTPQGSIDSAPVDILQPIMPPVQAEVLQSPPPSTTAQATPKQPVGRPPKPLMTDQLWTVLPEDFIWVKNMSRQPIAEFKDTLHQKAVQQIRLHKPGLMEDWQFTGQFEQAFMALCTTYELIPALRHDILKALLNGRVVENLRKSSGNPAPSGAMI